MNKMLGSGRGCDHYSLFQTMFDILVYKPFFHKEVVVL
jgi:hypothetical protein